MDSMIKANEHDTKRLLTEELAKYRLVMESSADWIWTANLPNYELSMFNKSFYDYFDRYHGIKICLGMKPNEMFSEDRLNLWLSYYAEAVTEGTFQFDYETQAYKKYMSFIISPLIVEGEVVGVSIFGRDVTQENAYKRDMVESNQKLSLRLRQAIHAISKIGQLRDAYTAGHQKRVAQLACAIAKVLGLSEERIDNLYLSAMIHDIGKIYVASDILNKPGRISSLEYQILQTHVEYSYEILKEIDFANEIPLIAYQHHERLDGSGYPLGIKGDEIILESRIIAVADVVEAMASHRPYRAALGIKAALDEIAAYKGIRYDQNVVETCIELFKEKNFRFDEHY